MYGLGTHFLSRSLD